MKGIYAYINIYVCTHIFQFLALQNSTCLTLYISEAVHSICIVKFDVSQIFLVDGAALTIGFSALAEK